MNALIYKNLKSALLFTDEEYNKWKKIFEVEHAAESFLEAASSKYLLPHYNAAKDFIGLYTGSYEKASVEINASNAKLSFFSPSLTGYCGVQLYLTRNTIEVRQLVNQDSKIMALLKNTLQVK